MEASSRESLVLARERLEQLSRPASGVLERAKDRLTGQPARAATGPELLSLADELFAVGRLLNGELTLRRALSDPAGRPEDRAALAQRLFASKISGTTLDLVQTVARVTTAVPLTAAQEQRLTQVLGRIYGRTIGLQVTVDPSVLGGLVVQVGDEVIDGSIAHRLEAAQRRLAG